MSRVPITKWNVRNHANAEDRGSIFSGPREFFDIQSRYCNNTIHVRERGNKLSPVERRNTLRNFGSPKNPGDTETERMRGETESGIRTEANARAGEPLSASRGTWLSVQVENDTGYKRRIRKFRGAMKNATAELSSTWIFHRCELSPGRESYSRDSHPSSSSSPSLFLLFGPFLSLLPANGCNKHHV